MIAQDLEAEQAVLGVLLMDASLVGSLELQAGHFSDATHQGIFHEVRSGYENNRTVSPVSLKEKFDPQYLAGLVSSRGIIDLHGYSKRLIELCTTRQLRQAAEYVLSGASNSECVAALTNAIDDAARESLSSQLRTAQQVALNVTNALADDAPCYPTGFSGPQWPPVEPTGLFWVLGLPPIKPLFLFLSHIAEYFLASRSN